jgi:hypothetical protein
MMGITWAEAEEMGMKNSRHDESKEAERRNALPGQFSVNVLSAIFYAIVFLNKLSDVLEESAHLTVGSSEPVDGRCRDRDSDVLRTFCPNGVYLFPEFLTPVYQLLYALLNVLDTFATARWIYFNSDLFGAQTPKDGPYALVERLARRELCAQTTHRLEKTLPVPSHTLFHYFCKRSVSSE